MPDWLWVTGPGQGMGMVEWTGEGGEVDDDDNAREEKDPWPRMKLHQIKSIGLPSGTCSKIIRNIKPRIEWGL